MAPYQNSIMINRPVEDVFAVLSNAENDPKWQSGAIEVTKTSRGPIGVDTTWRSVGRLLGRPFESETEYTEYESGWKYTVRSTSAPFQFESQVTLDQVAGVTRVSIAAEAEPAAFFKLAEAQLLAMFKRQIQGDLANLKDLMESDAL